MRNSDPLLTMKEVAELLRTSVSSLRQWRHKGIGPASILIGGRVRYRSSAVEAYLNSRTSRP